MKDKIYFTQTELLKERGWTQSLIKKYLQEPCLVKNNPKYKNSYPMKLFSIEKVKLIENTETFISEFEKKRKTREKKSFLMSERKEKEKVSLIQHVNSIVFDIPLLQKNILFKKSCEHYENLWSERGEFRTVNNTKDLKFLCRISVNFLRHNELHYEQEIEDMFGKSGKREGYILLKRRILDKIKTVYPFLKEECDDQLMVVNAIYKVYSQEK